MARREQGIRRTTALTAGVAAASILGSVGIALTAYAQDQATSADVGSPNVQSTVPGASSSTGRGPDSPYPSVIGVPGTVGAEANSGGS